MFSALMTKLLELTCKKVIIYDPYDQDPYLIRYILFGKSKFNIYFHRFMRSDDKIPHDHPFNFFTFVFTKGYKEIKYIHNTETGILEEKEINRYPMSIAYRKHNDIHRVVVDKTRTLEEINDAPLTVCVLYRCKSTWGFVKNTKRGYEWIDWRKFLKVKKNDSRYAASE